MRKNFKSGEIIISAHGTTVELVERVSKSHWLVKTPCGDLITVNQGRMRNSGFSTPVCKTVYGVGYLGIGNFVCRNESGKITDEYATWANILKRCYTNYETNRTAESYTNATVCEKWHNFQNFAKWYVEETALFKNNNVKPKVDKDLKSTNSRLYSESTCSILPNIINSTIVSNKKNATIHNGVRFKNGKYCADVMHKYKKIWCGSYDRLEDAIEAHKNAKEKFVKELAEEYKNILAPDVYNLLLTWEFKS